LKVWRSLNRIKNWWTGRGKKGDIVQRLQDVINRANALLMKLNIPADAMPQAQAGSKSIVIEAGKGTRVEKYTQIGGLAPQHYRPKKPYDPKLQTAKEIALNRARNVQPDEQVENALPTANPVIDPTLQRKVLEQGMKHDEEAAYQNALQNRQTAVDEASYEASQNPGPPPATQPAQPTSKPVVGDITKEYGRLINDLSGLVNDLSGFATTNQDPQTAAYIRGALPLIQNFIGKSTQQKALPNPQARREFLRGSLQELVNGIQGVMAPEQAAPQAAAPQAGAPQAGAPQAGAPQTGWQGRGGAPQGDAETTQLTDYTIDLNNISDYDINYLRYADRLIQSRIAELEQPAAQATQPMSATGGTKPQSKLIKAK
jgi:hypothetical protein